MIDSGSVFVICLVVMLVQNTVTCIAEKFTSENFPLGISVISAFGSGVVVLILWLIEHVRFV